MLQRFLTGIQLFRDGIQAVSASLQVDAAIRKIGFSDFKQEASEAAKQASKEETKKGAKLKVS
ncbi:MAG: hypothetical protein GZ094_13455 [Mariniphaga sp.]|nr:hypothetical protein [Mariniphaga sp.]